MRKFIFIVSLSFLLVKSSSSQQLPKIEVSKPYSAIGAESNVYLSANENIIALKDNFIQQFNISQMKLNGMTEYSIPKDGNKEYICNVGNKTYLFYSIWDKALKGEKLFYKEINTKEGKMNIDEKALFNVNGKVIGEYVTEIGKSDYQFSYKWVGNYGADKFHFQFSCDSSKLLIACRKSSVAMEFNVFNSNFTKLYSKEVNFPYWITGICDYAIDDDGNIYIITKYHDKNSTDFHIELIKVDVNSGNITKNEIKFDANSVQQLSISEFSKEHLICVGLTYKKEDSMGPYGIVTFKIENGGLVSEKSYYKIPLEIINSYVPLNKQSKEDNDNVEFKYLHLSELIAQKDGSLLIIGEQIGSSPENKDGSVSYAYYEDILFTKINKDGTLAYMRRLPKKQRGSRSQDEISYKYMAGENYHYLVFTDNIKNINLPIDQRPEIHINGIDGYLTAYKLQDIDGKTEKISILNLSNIKGNEGFLFDRHRLIPISLSTFIFEVNKKNKEDLLVKVTF